MTSHPTFQPHSPATPQTPAMLLKTATESSSAAYKKAIGFLKFADASPTPFHAVQTASNLLQKAGFVRISERDDFAQSFTDGKLQRGGKYFYTRNQSSLVAFALPREQARNVGMSIVAGHTDSPCPKLRPISKKTKGSYLMAGVETYGGGIWASWVSPFSLNDGCKAPLLNLYHLILSSTETSPSQAELSWTTGPARRSLLGCSRLIDLFSGSLLSVS